MIASARASDQQSHLGAARAFARRSALAVAVVVSIVAIIAAASWSAASDRDAAVADFSHGQALLATAVGTAFEDRLDHYLTRRGIADASHEAADSGRELPDDAIIALLDSARNLGTPSELLVLVGRPGQRGFLTLDRRVIASTRLRSAIDNGDTAAIVPREEAPSFGLPPRKAVAGIARVADRGSGPWGIVVLASAERLRDRQKLDDVRLGITVLAATLVVAAFGMFARQRMRAGLELERAVAVSSALREREAALAKADKMATMAALSTGIAHEVGTPLSVIVGRVEQVLGRLEEDARSSSALRVVLEQVERIERIVRGCLALARGETPHLVSTSPVVVAERALELVQHRFDKERIGLVFTRPETRTTIACDPSLLEQALVNVLLNACQATPADGNVTLSVNAGALRVSFVVDDEGAGISEADATRAAEPFFSTKRAEGGTGLGLTIAREIVKHHGGELALGRRTEGVGTRATISLPASPT